MSKIVPDANGTSTFFPVEEANVAMFFVPVAVHVDHAPMIVYFHGWSSADGTLPKSIEEYIASNPVRDFRPLLKLKKVTLLEPWGGTYSKQFFSAATPLGLPAMIDAATSQTRPGSLIITGFSGGGVALRNTVLQLGGTAFSLLSEVWCLDCMYSHEGDEWGNWSRKTGKRLRVGLSSGESSGLPRAQEGNIGKGAQISIEHFDCGHEPLPGRCIKKWLLDASNP